MSPTQQWSDKITPHSMSNPTTREKLTKTYLEDFPYTGRKDQAMWWLDKLESELTLREKEVSEKYRGHLRFIWRWISRLNGDKEHDRPEENWREYVKVLINYPSAPYQTKDWFEDVLPLTSEDNS